MVAGGTPRTVTDRDGRTAQPDRLPVPHLVRVLDYERPRLPSSIHRVAGLAEVSLGRGERDGVMRTEHTLSLAVADPRMSQHHASLSCTAGQWTVEDRGSRNGMFVDGEKTDRAELTDGTLIETGRTAFLFRLLEPVEPPDVDASTLSLPLGELHTFSPSFARALANVARIALSASSIVLFGETGTGKELLARGIHTASRRKGDFVAVNCGALPDTLVESELFGYRKGAFSGAAEDRAGLVRGADRGTLFLDEIGDLPLETQAALLRVLQEREVVPIGATKPIEIDIRVIAASHRDLEAEVEAGRFREDLLARLAGYIVEIPAVRERREDLGILIAALLGRQSTDIRFTPAAGAALLRHTWPRNVRELEQVLRSATALAIDGVVELDHLPRALQSPSKACDDLSPSDVQRRDELRALLAKHRGNIAAVARELGVARMQVHRWLERFAIDIAEFRGS